MVKDLDWNEKIPTEKECDSIRSIRLLNESDASMTCFKTGSNDICVTRDTEVHVGIPDQESMHECLVNAKDIKEGYWIKMIVPDIVIDIPELSIDDCKMAAYICRYGGFVTSGNAKDQLIFLPNDESNLNFIKTYMDSLEVDVEIRQTSSYTYVTWPRDNVNLKFHPFCLRDSRIRRLPASMMHLPKEKTNAIIEILIGIENCVEIDSLTIIDQLQYLLFRIGKPSNVTYKRSKGILSLWPKDYYTMFAGTLFGRVIKTGMKCPNKLTYILKFTEEKKDVSTTSGTLRI